MRWLGLIAILLYVPSFVSAQVLITEIMYAPEGADAKREWVEVCNTGANLQDIQNWKFFENDVNHGLTLISGTGELSSGDCAVIADNTDAFLTDYVSFSGNLFDSAFSLKNTGETIALKNENDEIVDTVTYSDSDGAKDDGLSLHRSGNNLTAETPSPGSEEGIGGGIQDDNSDSSQGQSSGGSGSGQTTNTTIYSYESVTIEPPQDVYIRVPEKVITTSGAFTKFTLESYDAIGQVVVDGNVRWSFGDGAEATGRDVGHNFLYEGTYIVTVELTKGTLTDSKQITVTVLPLEAEIYVADDGEWVSIVNTSANELNLSRWRLISSGQYFNIPENTIIQANSEVRFATDVTKLTFLKANAVATLLYPSGKIARGSTLASQQIIVTEEDVVQVDQAEEIVEEQTVAVQETVNKSLPIIGHEVPKKIEATNPVPVIEVTEIKKLATGTAEIAETQVASVVLGVSKTDSGSSAYWYFGLAMLLLLAIVGILLGRPRALVVDGFEVTETKE